MDRNLLQRLIFGFIYGVVIVLGTTPYGEKLFGLVGLTVKQHFIYYGLLGLILIFSVWELLSILKLKQGWQRLFTLPLTLAAFYYFTLLYFNGKFDYQLNLSHLLALFLLLVICLILFFYKSELETDSGKLVFTVLYSAIPLGFALGLIQFDYLGGFSLEAFFLFVLIWSSDSFAYFSGRFFGKHLMAPTISPKKTWEGFFGGVLLTLVLAYFIELNFPEMRGNWIVVGLLVAVFAPLGDLVESQLKRNFGVKDSGKLIPGHGGILDRLDSFLLCAPVLYLYFLLETLF